MEFKENNKGKGIVIVLLIILIVLVLAAGGFLVYDKVLKKDNAKVDTDNGNKNQDNVLVSLDVTSANVKKLQKYVTTHYKSNNYNITLNSEYNYSLIIAVLNMIPKDNINFTKPNEIGLSTATVNKDTFTKYYKEMYNADFTSDLVAKFGATEDKNGSLIFKDLLMDGQCEYVKLVKAEQLNDEIYLYEEYAFVSNGGEILSSMDTKDVLIPISEEYQVGDYFTNPACDSLDGVKGKLVNLIPTYKHTFKENTDGTYYWYSSELVNK